MLAPGMAVIRDRIAFRHCTIYNNMYARDGNNNTTNDSHSMAIAAGITMKFVSRK